MNKKKIFILILALALVLIAFAALFLNDDTASEKDVFSCTLEVRCDQVLDNKSQLKGEKADIIPSDGVIYSGTQIEFYDGETVFDVLKRKLQEEKIHFDFEYSKAFDSAYAEGIGNLYSFDCGEMSGWLYRVNGVSPDVGCSQYRLKDGDRVEFYYSCDMSKEM